MNKDFKNGWRCLKKMAKPSYSSTSPTCIKSKFGQDIISPTKQLDRWAEYYKDLASDPSGHSLNRNFWIHALWDILFKNQIISGDYSKTPFLMRSSALLTEIIPGVSTRQGLLFRKYKFKQTRSVNVENAV